MGDMNSVFEAVEAITWEPGRYRNDAYPGIPQRIDYHDDGSMTVTVDAKWWGEIQTAIGIARLRVQQAKEAKPRIMGPLKLKATCVRCGQRSDRGMWSIPENDNQWVCADEEACANRAAVWKGGETHA